jgi:hypothetical protein
MTNKEFGSDFETYFFEEGLDYKKSIRFFPENTLFSFSGRVALYSVLHLGITEYQWERIYIPSYYCMEVYDFIEELDIEVIYYECDPFTKNIDFSKVIDNSSSAFLLVDFFGVNKLNAIAFEKCFLIEDLTHNLGHLKKSNADYCFGSLRKVLPMGSGGFLFSHKKRRLPELFNKSFAELVAYKRSVAMFLKRNYLVNDSVDKFVYREQFIETERLFMDKKTMSLLPNISFSEMSFLDIDYLICKKKQNLKIAKKLILENDCFELFTSNANDDFALILIFSDMIIRDKFRTFLIKRKIYPMVLWPNQRVDKKGFESKALFVHIDFRYDENDIIFIVDTINSFKENVES